MKKSKRKSENNLKQMKIKAQLSKIKSRSRREVHNDTDLPQETRKISS